MKRKGCDDTKYPAKRPQCVNFCQEHYVKGALQSLQDVFLPELCMEIVAFLWEEGTDWIVSEDDVRIACTLVQDRPRQDPCCEQLSKLVHSEFHHLAHKPWYRVPERGDVKCMQCALSCVDDPKAYNWPSEFANWLLRQERSIDNVNIVEQATDIKLLEKIRYSALQWYISPFCSAEFVEVFAPWSSAATLSAFNNPHLLAWLKKRPRVFKRVVHEAPFKRYFRGVMTNSELIAHFGLEWASDHSLLQDELCSELEAYFAQDRSQRDSVNASYLKLPEIRALALRSPQKMNSSEVTQLSCMARKGALSTSEAETVALELLRRGRVLPSRLYKLCRKDWWLSLTRDECLRLTTIELNHLVRIGVPLARMDQADALAEALIASEKAPRSNWRIIKALMDKDSVMNLVLDSGTWIDLTEWELRQLAARVQNKDKLFPVLGNVCELNVPLIMSLGLSAKTLAGKSCRLMKCAMEHKEDVLCAWLAWKWGWQPGKNPVVSRTADTKHVSLSDSRYVERYERFVLTHDRDDFDALENMDKALLASYALWCWSLELVEPLWRDRSMTNKHLVLAMQNPDGRVAEFALRRTCDLDRKKVICKLIKQGDCKGVALAVRMFQRTGLETSIPSRCVDFAMKHRLWETAYFLQSLAKPQELDDQSD